MSPLVTTQALKNVRLRSVKMQEFTRTNSLPTIEATKPEAVTFNLELLRKKANSDASINEKPRLQDKLEQEKDPMKASDGNMSQNQQEASDATLKTVSEESKMFFSAEQASDEAPNCGNVNLELLKKKTSSDASINETPELQEKLEQEKCKREASTDGFMSQNQQEASSPSKIFFSAEQTSHEALNCGNINVNVEHLRKNPSLDASINETLRLQDEKEEEKCQMKTSRDENMENILSEKQIVSEREASEAQKEVSEESKRFFSAGRASHKTPNCENMNLELLTKKPELQNRLEQENFAPKASGGGTIAQILRESQIISGHEASNPQIKVFGESKIFFSAEQTSHQDPNCGNELLRKKPNFDALRNETLELQEKLEKHKMEASPDGNVSQTWREKQIISELEASKVSEEPKMFYSAKQTSLEAPNCGNINVLTSAQSNLSEDSKMPMENGFGKVLDNDSKAKETKESGKDEEISREFSLEELEMVLRDLEASVEDLDSETSFQSQENESNVTEMQEKAFGAQIRSSDVKVQNAQVTSVKQYKLQTTENYFRTQDSSQNCAFTDRNQAYLDMYALLAESTASTLKQDRDLNRNEEENRHESKSKAKCSYYDVTERDVTELSHKTTGLNDRNDTDLSLNPVSDELWVKKQTDSEESQYWSLCRGEAAKLSQKQENKTRSPVKPSLPKKPDLGILGLLNKTAKRDDSVEEKAQIASTKQNLTSPRREKPPIVHKKPNLATQSLNRGKKTENVEDFSEVWAVREVQKDSAISDKTVLENVDFYSKFPTGSFKNQSSKCGMFADDLEAVLEERAAGFNGFLQNGSTKLNCAMKETYNNGHLERFESCDDEVWQSLEDFEQVNSGNNQNSWMENLENLGSHRRSRVVNVEKSSENVWSSRKEQDGSLTGFCAAGNQGENVKVEKKEPVFVEKEKILIKKPPRNKQKVLMQKDSETWSESSSGSSSGSWSESWSDSDSETRLNSVMSQESSRVIGQSCSSLSSALSTESLKEALFLPDLLIHEEDSDVFVGVSADQVTVPDQTRSTDDLFAVIHSAVWEGTV